MHISLFSFCLFLYFLYIFLTLSSSSFLFSLVTLINVLCYAQFLIFHLFRLSFSTLYNISFCLKEVCHKIFDLKFVIFNPSGPLLNRLKYFRIWFRFRRDIRSQSSIRCVQQTAEIISTVCNIPRRSSQRCATHRGVNLSGVQHTISAVCNTSIMKKMI